MSNTPQSIEGPGGARKVGMLLGLVAGVLFLTALGAFASRDGGASGDPKMEATKTRGAEVGAGEALAVAGASRKAAAGAVSFEGRLDRGAVLVGSSGDVHLELITRGKEREGREMLRQPTDVTVILDRSGSMEGDPFVKARAAVRELIAELGDNDRFGLVAYSDEAQLVIPMAQASSQARRDWVRRVDALSASGGTNMSAGLDRAHALLKARAEIGRVARMVLLSDGHANQGDSTAEGLSRRASRAIRGEYVLSTVGVGDGFDERLMTRLADAGTGNFYYVPDAEVLAGIFRDEFESARETVAQALEIEIRMPREVEVVDAAGYPLERRNEVVLLRPGGLFAGQERSFWVTLRVPTGSEALYSLGEVSLRYRPVGGATADAQIALPAFPKIRAVQQEAEFAAQLDEKAVARHHEEEVVGRLRQAVSELISSGEYARAQAKIDSVDFDDFRALGYEKEATASFAKIQEMKQEIDSAAAAPAAEQAGVQNRLGKKLYESGTDGRRKGAKRSK